MKFKSQTEKHFERIALDSTAICQFISLHTIGSFFLVSTTASDIKQLVSWKGLSPLLHPLQANHLKQHYLYSFKITGNQTGSSNTETKQDFYFF